MLTSVTYLHTEVDMKEIWCTLGGTTGGSPCTAASFCTSPRSRRSSSRSRSHFSGGRSPRPSCQRCRRVEPWTRQRAREVPRLLSLLALGGLKILKLGAEEEVEEGRQGFGGLPGDAIHKNCSSARCNLQIWKKTFTMSEGSRSRSEPEPTEKKTRSRRRSRQKYAAPVPAPRRYKA